MPELFWWKWAIRQPVENKTFLKTEDIMETKDSYTKKMKAKFDELNDKWQMERTKLEGRAQDAKAEVKKKFEEQMEVFKKNRDKMRQKLSQIDHAGEDSWKDIKKGVDTAWKALNEAIKKARSHFD
jgi:small-conductance mechanosensitive channel